MSKHSKYVAATILILFAALLRLAYLTTIPHEMHIDEAGLGLNAWSIAHFGTDRYGNFLPVCPSNFYGEQSAFYTYFCALLVKFFGLNLWTLRLPGAVMGILSVVFGSLIIKEKWGEKGFFTGMILFSIFPYFVMNSRFALDCNAMLGMLSIALYCLIRTYKKAIQNTNRNYYALFLLTGILLGLVLYTYIIAAIVVALFCILFGFYYLLFWKEGRIHRFKQLCFIALPLIIMVIPLLLVFCVNYFGWDSIETPFFTIPKMLVNRTEEVEFSLTTILNKVKWLRYPLTSDGKFGSSDKYWTMYRFSVPFILLGGLFSLGKCISDRKKHELSIDAVLLMATFSEVVLFLLCGQYNYHINGIFVLLGYFCVNGILSITLWLHKRALKITFVTVCIGLYLLSFVGFSLEYYGSDTSTAYMVYGGVDEALRMIPSERAQSDVYILNEVGEIYFLSNPKSPSEFLPYYDEYGLIRDFGNLHFHEPEDYQPGDILLGNRAQQRYLNYLGTDTTKPFTLLETEHYYVFYE